MSDLSDLPPVLVSPGVESLARSLFPDSLGLTEFLPAAVRHYLERNAEGDGAIRVDGRHVIYLTRVEDDVHGKYIELRTEDEMKAAGKRTWASESPWPSDS